MFEFLNNFLMYLLTRRKGVARMHVPVYVLENILRLYYRTIKWVFPKLIRIEVRMSPHLCI